MNMIWQAKVKGNRCEAEKEGRAEAAVLFANPMEQEVVAEIQSLDLSNMTPMKALVYLSELQEKLTNKEDS